MSEVRVSLYMKLVNHEVSPSLLEKLKYEIEDFFKLPMDEKMKYRVRPGDVEGYGNVNRTNDDQKLDWSDRVFMITNPILRRKPHLLPQLPPSLRYYTNFFISVLSLNCHQIFSIIIFFN